MIIPHFFSKTETQELEEVFHRNAMQRKFEPLSKFKECPCFYLFGEQAVAASIRTPYSSRPSRCLGAFLLTPCLYFLRQSVTVAHCQPFQWKESVPVTKSRGFILLFLKIRVRVISLSVFNFSIRHTSYSSRQDYNNRTKTGNNGRLVLINRYEIHT